MSYITRTGNLAATPVLRQGEHGPYTYARILVSDRLPDGKGGRVDGPVIGYDVAVSGTQAENLVAVAEASGNVRITFSGQYKVTEYAGDRGTLVKHEVRADDVAVSLRGQRVTVAPRDGKTQQVLDQQTQADTAAGGGWSSVADSAQNAWADQQRPE